MEIHGSDEEAMAADIHVGPDVPRPRRRGPGRRRPLQEGFEGPWLVAVIVAARSSFMNWQASSLGLRRTAGPGLPTDQIVALALTRHKLVSLAGLDDLSESTRRMIEGCGRFRPDTRNHLGYIFYELAETMPYYVPVILPDGASDDFILQAAQGDFYRVMTGRWRKDRRIRHPYGVVFRVPDFLTDAILRNGGPVWDCVFAMPIGRKSPGGLLGPCPDAPAAVRKFLRVAPAAAHVVRIPRPHHRKNPENTFKVEKLLECIAAGKVTSGLRLIHEGVQAFGKLLIRDPFERQKRILGLPAWARS